MCRNSDDLEIWDVVKGIGGLQALGPDFFFSHILSKILACYQVGCHLDDADFFHEWLPLKTGESLSHCNVAYKIISKILIVRLNRVMPKLVIQNQNAFVPHRYIQDNIILVHEDYALFKEES